jgi:predicted  nucleic acid-binding Zn ribbon protein
VFTAEIQFRIVRTTDDDAVVRGVYGLFSAWRGNGQILNDEWPLAKSRSVVRAFVTIPERTSLQRKRDNKSVTQQRNDLADVGLAQPTTTTLGHDPTSIHPCRCAEQSAYILYTDHHSMESPLRCAECFGSIPLYRIPHTTGGRSYDDIIFWRSTYQDCDALEIGCSVGERFATRQMVLVNSPLSTMGIECCQRITDVTKKPCYYRLYRYYGRSKKQEAQRRCPSCGRKWRLKDPWHVLFDFRCDRCHLLSNYAHSIDM